MAQLGELFDYSPSEKIIINTFDYNDYGTAGTTTVPHNFIRVEIEPLEPGYENIPYDERIKWLLAHELVHIVINDLSSRSEGFFRAVFSKVPPEKEQPLSVFYSLLTNHNRYTPDWYQEGIAVFMETWLNGGYGRVLGNFDEMVFRTMVVEDKAFPSLRELEVMARYDSFLLGILNYLYGARFAAYLARTYGAETMISCYKTPLSEFYKHFETKFKETFGSDLASLW